MSAGTLLLLLHQGMVAKSDSDSGSGLENAPTIGVAPTTGDFGSGVEVGAGYLLVPNTTGSYVATPDSGLLSITGSFQIRAMVALDDWTPTGALTDNMIANKTISSPLTVSWYFGVYPGGVLELGLSANGASGAEPHSTVAPTVSDGQYLGVGAKFNAVTGDVTFETSSDGGFTWTQLGSVVGTALRGIYDSTLPVEIGGQDQDTNYKFAGKIKWVEIRNGIDGTVVARPDFTAAGRSPFTDPQGNVWTLNGSAALASSGGPTIGVVPTTGDSGSGDGGVPSVAAAVSQVDVSSGSDAGEPLIRPSVADVSSGAEAEPGIGVSSSDVGSGAEAVPSVAAAMAGTDAGSGSDVGAPLIQPISSDVGVGTETGETAEQETHSDDDAGSSAEGAPSVTAAVPSTDAGSGIEAVPLVVAELAGVDITTAVEGSPAIGVAPGVDVGTGTENAPLVAAELADADGGGGAENAPTINLSLVPDIGTGVDDATIAAALGGTDLGVAVEATPAVGVQSDGDTSSGTEVTQQVSTTMTSSDSAGVPTEVEGPVGVVVADATSGAEAVPSLTAALDGQDVSAASDMGVPLIQPSAVDSGSGAENPPPPPEQFVSSTDSGAGIEGAAAVVAQVAGLDNSAAAELTLILAALASQDMGSGAEVSGLVTTNMAGQDTGTGATEVLVSVTASVLTADTSVGADVLSGIVAQLAASDQGTSNEPTAIVTVTSFDADTGASVEVIALVTVLTANLRGVVIRIRVAERHQEIVVRSRLQTVTNVDRPETIEPIEAMRVPLAP